MLNKILIPIFIIFLVGMVAYIFWPQKKVTKIVSLKSALSESQQLACDYVDVDGLQTKTYVKAGMLRSDFVDKQNDENSGGLLVREGKTYVWWTKDKHGLVAESAVDNSAQKNQVISDIEKYKNFCKNAVVADTLFIVPADVQFRDFFTKVTPTLDPTQQ